MADEPANNLPIEVPPEWQTGVYANFALVSTQTPHDVTLDFCQVIPADTPQAVVVARLKLSPSFLMPLLQVLSNHLARHEELGKLSEEEGEQ